MKFSGKRHFKAIRFGGNFGKFDDSGWAKAMYDVIPAQLSRDTAVSSWKCNT